MFVVLVFESVLEDIWAYVKQPEAEVLCHVKSQLHGDIGEGMGEGTQNEMNGTCCLTSDLLSYCHFNLIISSTR